MALHFEENTFSTNGRFNEEHSMAVFQWDPATTWKSGARPVPHATKPSWSHRPGRNGDPAKWLNSALAARRALAVLPRYSPRKASNRHQIALEKLLLPSFRLHFPDSLKTAQRQKRNQFLPICIVQSFSIRLPSNISAVSPVFNPQRYAPSPPPSRGG